MKKQATSVPAAADANEPLSYETARSILENAAHNRALAVREDAPPEILNYLAENGADDVRALVAGNPAAPHTANILLTDDEIEDVRCELARKISRLLPGLCNDDQTKLRDGAIEVIEKLARDHLPRVRQILSQELKESTHVPPHVVKRLANDLEAIVAIPIVEYSPLLSDADLIEIIATSKVEGVLKAVAQRREVSEPVSDAIVATLDVPAVAALLTNANAQIREATLDSIIQQANGVDAWHEPLVLRPSLSLRAIRRISTFVASALVEALCERHRLDSETERELKSRMRSRIDHEEPEDDGPRGAFTSEAMKKAYEEGRLDDSFVEQVANSGQIELAIESLQLLTGFPAALVRRILETKNAKPVSALAWKAGLSMRTALTLQRRIARIPQPALLLPKDGTHYPMTPDEMTWHLDFFVGVAK